MRVVMTRIDGSVKCDVDGCRRPAEYAFDACVASPAGRLRLCGACLKQITQQYENEQSKGRKDNGVH